MTYRGVNAPETTGRWVESPLTYKTGFHFRVIPLLATFRVLQLRHRAAAEGVRPVGGRVEQAQNREERRLAAPRRSLNRNVLTVSDLQRDGVEGVGLDFVRVKDFADCVQVNERRRTFVHD